jgi:hypothetical protein
MKLFSFLELQIKEKKWGTLHDNPLSQNDDENG